MSSKIFWVQLGGNSVENDDKGHCFFPAHPMAPMSCAEEYGYEAKDLGWHGPTAGHRGHGSFANSRVLDFSDYDYCQTNCLMDYPGICKGNDPCKPESMGVEGWPNQVGFYDYYCRIKKTLKVGDCFATHMVPAIEDFTKFYYGVQRAAPGVQVKYKLMCGGIDLSPVIDAGVTGTKIQCTDIPKENRFADLCDGFDVVLMEIVAMPEEPAADACKEGKGLLDGLAIMGSVRTNAVCTGK